MAGPAAVAGGAGVALPISLVTGRVVGPLIARAAGKVGGSMAKNAVPYMMGRMSKSGGDGGGEGDFRESRFENFSQGSMSSTSPDSDRARFAYMHGLTG
jgi:hypothetical protein